MVAAWAAANPKIETAFIVGSRATKTERPDSDLDVAITLTERFGYGDWLFESDEWEADLQKMSPFKIHLLRGGGSLPNQIVQQAIEAHGVLAFERTK